jgi:hypothetical protein
MTREKVRRPHLLTWAGVIASWMLVCGADGMTGSAAETPVGVRRGVSTVLGLPQAGQPDFVIELARQGEQLVYFQSPDAEEVLAVREAAEAAGQPGNRVFAAEGGFGRIHLASSGRDARRRPGRRHA